MIILVVVLHFLLLDTSLMFSSILMRVMFLVLLGGLSRFFLVLARYCARLFGIINSFIRDLRGLLEYGEG